MQDNSISHGEQISLSTRIPSTRLLIKKTFFSFFTLTPSQMWLKRPVYRGFSGEGRCFLPSHYPHTLISLQKRPAYQGQE